MKSSVSLQEDRNWKKHKRGRTNEIRLQQTKLLRNELTDSHVEETDSSHRCNIKEKRQRSHKI